MGASPLFVRLADVGPFASAFWRTALALPVLWAWMKLEDRGRAQRAGFTRPAVLAGLFFAGDLFFWHLSILNTTVANATFFATTAPLWVVFASVVVLRQKVTGATYLGLGFCLAGGAALLGHSAQVDPARLVGDAYGLITAVFFAGYFLAIQRARATHGAARITFLSTLVTTACLALVALIAEPTLWPKSTGGIAALVAVALVSQVGGQGLLAVALGALPAVFSSLVIFLEAIAAAVLGWLVLGEALTWTQGGGGLLILAGLWIARPRRAKGEG